MCVIELRNPEEVEAVVGKVVEDEGGDHLNDEEVMVVVSGVLTQAIEEDEEELHSREGT